MISHEHKCIFIHIPKCAGTSVKYFLFPNREIHWFDANYEVLHGWCPDRKFFMQHATAVQLLDTGLISDEQWKTYYKFTFVRNPWDRAVSDYFWLMQDRKIRDSFKNYLDKSGKFSAVLNDIEATYYRGDHLIPQSRFFETKGPNKMDFVGRFENFESDMQKVAAELGMESHFDLHINKRIKKRPHYSKMYTNALQEKVNNMYSEDIDAFGYTFDDQRTLADRIKLKFS